MTQFDGSDTLHRRVIDENLRPRATGNADHEHVFARDGIAAIDRVTADRQCLDQRALSEREISEISVARFSVEPGTVISCR